MPKRFRRPVLKDGELQMYYGKLPKDQPDVIIDWRGQPDMKRDSYYLYLALCCPRRLEGLKFEPSFLDELKARGYDIQTIKFSIKKKV